MSLSSCGWISFRAVNYDCLSDPGLEQERATGAFLRMLAGDVLGENVAMAKELERLGAKSPVGITYAGRVSALVKLMGSAGENVYSVDFVAIKDTSKGKALLDRAKQYLSEDEMKKVNRYTSPDAPARRPSSKR